MNTTLNNKRLVLLVSPGPIDGYPPVQYQAKLFAEIGYKVIVVTSALSGKKKCDFECYGVSVSLVNLSQSSVAARFVSKILFVAAVSSARKKLGSSLIAEIAYDTDGIWFSRKAPLKRPGTLGVAHLHEALIDPMNRFYERAACKSIHSFDRVVVADRNRGDLLVSQLGLEEMPLVIPNYPLLELEDVRATHRDSMHFKVAYAGSIGFHQGFEAIISSLPDWDDSAKLYIAGNDNTAQARQISKRIEQLGMASRVVFLGLMPLHAVSGFLASSDLGLTLLCPIHDQWRYAAGASNKRYQCMQAGIAQISDTNPDVPELIEQQGLGLCVNPDDPNAIAAAVNYYVRNREKCRLAGIRAYDHYRTKYHYQIPFKQLLNWIESRTDPRRLAPVTSRYKE